MTSFDARFFFLCICGIIGKFGLTIKHINELVLLMQSVKKEWGMSIKMLFLILRIYSPEI